MPATEDTRAERARSIRDRARQSPATVDPQEPMALLETTRSGTRRDAIEALHEIAIVRPDEVVEAVPRLVSLLDETDQFAEVQILEIVTAVAVECPDIIEPVSSQIFSRIADVEADPVLRAAVRACAAIATDRPNVAVDAVPRLSIALERSDTGVKRHALAALSAISREYPAEISPLVGACESHLESDDPAILQGALATLGRVIARCPVEAESVVDGTKPLLQHESTGVRANATGLLGDYVRYEMIGEDVIASLVEAIADEADIVRVNAMTAVGHLAVTGPDAVTDHASVILAALDDEDPRVRERACFVVGIARLDSGVERLERLLDSETDDAVQVRAVWALERLA